MIFLINFKGIQLTNSIKKEGNLNYTILKNHLTQFCCMNYSLTLNLKWNKLYLLIAI